VKQLSFVEKERKKAGFKCPFYQERVCNTDPCPDTSDSIRASAAEDETGGSAVDPSYSLLRPKIFMKGDKIFVFKFSTQGRNGKPFPYYQVSLPCDRYLPRDKTLTRVSSALEVNAMLCPTIVRRDAHTPNHTCANSLWCD
jgi:hypothetical protein